MSVGSRFFVLMLAGLVSCAARADDDPAYENWLVRVGDYETLANSWRGEAMSGNAEKQERLAALLLGPHARDAKAKPYEGTYFLFRAAVNGRRRAMLQLADALNMGAFGFVKRPDAATCWSGAPAGFEGRLACVELTDFTDPLERVTCTELAVIDAKHSGKHDGAAMAKLCLANKTAAILVPGPPPSRQTLERAREYARHGIEWAVTGDVYREEFEQFREKFNQTIIAALEARHGRGYMDRLSKEINARLAGK